MGNQKSIKSLPINDIKSLQDIELEQPIATGRELLVKVQAIAVNPVDYTIRTRMAGIDGNYKVLAWDTVGEVVATGEDVNTFKPGDVVYYAGDLNRQGSNTEYQLVDARIVGIKPRSVTAVEAVALPLTTITAKVSADSPSTPSHL
ncbi:hypothetical protein JWH17_22410 [Desulfobulbus marinus]|nr:alcohol dehydrogenase catalytic domain-containing protein [Desulfogranum marinum]MBM9515158.1 hypothetical protein [Desulfogranum marinum]